MINKTGIRIAIVTTFLLLVLPILSQQKKYTRQEYILEYKDIAIRQMNTHGIPASIILAQACLESGDGNSELALKANNHFGIKCHDWKGPSVRYDDDEKNECFRKYKKVEESFTDHSNFLRYRDRYAFLFDLDVTDYKGWAYGLKKAGYATNPQYAELLIRIIEDNKLHEYDRKANKSVIPPTPAQLEEVKELKPLKSSPLYKFSINRKLYVQNKTAYIISNEFDTYESIAKEYNLFKGELLRFNDLRKDQEIAPGTIVYVQKKRKKAAKYLNLHIVENNNETLYQIAQRYAVQLEYLMKYNSAESLNEKLNTGDEIKLRKK